MIYLVEFNANRGLFEPAPQPFFDEVIRPPTRAWIRPMIATWLVATSEQIDQLDARLRQRLFTNDRLLIMKIEPTTQYRGWLPKDAWDWITAQAASGAYFS